jgi:hypothetical protein
VNGVSTALSLVTHDALTYDAFGPIGATFRELDWKTPILFERVVPISPNASHAYV